MLHYAYYFFVFLFMSALIPEKHSAQIAQRLHSEKVPCVVCLCAAWCSACEQYRAVFDDLARSYPEGCFVWVDIEVHADSLGDIEIDNFPTLFLEDAKGVRFFGEVLPNPWVVEQFFAHWEDLPYLSDAPPLREPLRSQAWHSQKTLPTTQAHALDSARNPT